jgi:SpoVK/Ycf46/Vps4 family AAA+-type ATPase
MTEIDLISVLEECEQDVGISLFRSTKTDTSSLPGQRVNPRSLSDSNSVGLLLKSKATESHFRYNYQHSEQSGHTQRIEEWRRIQFNIENTEPDVAGDDLTQFTVVVESPSSGLISELSSHSTLRIQLEELAHTKRQDDEEQLEEPTLIRPVAEERVVGLYNQKRKLKRFLKGDEGGWGIKPRTGYLLAGPPGTGKTELVIEVCTELYGSMPSIISGPEILSRWVGESERALRQKYKNAEQSSSKVLYIDELDAIGRSRAGNTQEYSAQIVAQLLVLLDGVEQKQNNQGGTPVRIIASTNMPDVLDPALLRPGRLGNDPIQFTEASKLESAGIIHHYLEKVRRYDSERLGESLSKFVTKGECSPELVRLFSRCEGRTGAELEQMVRTAVVTAKRDEMQGSKRQLRAEHLEEAVFQV